MSATSNLSWFYGRSTRPWSGRSFGSSKYYLAVVVNVDNDIH